MNEKVLTIDVKTLLYSELQIGNIIKQLSTSPNKQVTDKTIAKGIELVMYWVNIRTPFIKERVLNSMQVSMGNWGNEFNAYDVMCNPHMYQTNILENALMLVFKEMKKTVKEIKEYIKTIQKGLNIYMKEYVRTNGVIFGTSTYENIFKTLNTLPQDVVTVFNIHPLIALTKEEITFSGSDQNRHNQIHFYMQNLYSIMTNISMVV